MRKFGKTIVVVLTMVLMSSITGSAQDVSRLVTMNDTVTINNCLTVIDSLSKKGFTDFDSYSKNENKINSYLSYCDSYIKGLEKYFLEEENGKYRSCIKSERNLYNSFVTKRDEEKKKAISKWK
jgi:hypothetical protein